MTLFIQETVNIISWRSKNAPHPRFYRKHNWKIIMRLKQIIDEVKDIKTVKIKIENREGLYS